MKMDSGVFLESEFMLSPVKILMMRNIISKLVLVVTCLQ